MLDIWSSDLMHLIAESLCPFTNLSPVSQPPSPWHPLSTLFLQVWFFLDLMCKWCNTVLVLLCLTYLTWHNDIKVHSCCHEWQYSWAVFNFFSHLSSIPLYVCHFFFLNTLTQGYVYWFSRERKEREERETPMRERNIDMRNSWLPPICAWQPWRSNPLSHPPGLITFLLWFSSLWVRWNKVHTLQLVDVFLQSIDSLSSFP